MDNSSEFHWNICEIYVMLTECDTHTSISFLCAKCQMNTGPHGPILSKDYLLKCQMNSDPLGPMFYAKLWPLKTVLWSNSLLHNDSCYFFPIMQLTQFLRAVPRFYQKAGVEVAKSGLFSKGGGQVQKLKLFATNQGKMSNLYFKVAHFSRRFCRKGDFPCPVIQ